MQFGTRLRVLGVVCIGLEAAIATFDEQKWGILSDRCKLIIVSQVELTGCQQPDFILSPS